MTDTEDKFERIVSRLKIPSQPRPEHRRSLWQRMVEVFQHALERYQRAGPIRRRWLAMSAPGGVLFGRTRQIVALGVILLAVAALLLQLTVGLMAAAASLRSWLGAPPPPPPAVAWTDVLDHIRSARTVRFTLTVESPGGQSQRYLVSILRPSRLRVVAPQWIDIIDQHFRKVLMLNPQAKTFSLGLLEQQPPDHRLPDVMAELAGLDPFCGRPTHSAVAGTAGFTALKDDRQWLIRVDAATAAPIYIRRQTPADNRVLTLTDLDWDALLEETDFLLSPPAGYGEEGR
jgi:hypothetical protein